MFSDKWPRILAQFHYRDKNSISTLRNLSLFNNWYVELTLSNVWTVLIAEVCLESMKCKRRGPADRRNSICAKHTNYFVSLLHIVWYFIAFFAIVLIPEVQHDTTIPTHLIRIVLGPVYSVHKKRYIGRLLFNKHCSTTFHVTRNCCSDISLMSPDWTGINILKTTHTLGIECFNDCHILHTWRKSY